MSTFTEWFQDQVDLYMRSMKLCSHKAFVTSRGLPGLGPEDVRQDDVVVVFEGAHNPFVIREQTDGTFRMVGACYIIGLMNGEAVRSGAARRDITLV
jgi:hypothetical protein